MIDYWLLLIFIKLIKGIEGWQIRTRGRYKLFNNLEDVGMAE